MNIYIYIFVISCAIFYATQSYPFPGDHKYFLSGHTSVIGDFHTEVYRWQVWTSRFIIDYLCFFLANKIVVWVILCSSCTVLFFAQVFKTFQTKSLQQIGIIMAFIFMFLPSIFDISAGIYATTLNYLVPISLGLYSLCYFLKIGAETNLKLPSSKNSIPKTVFALLTLLVATCSEQMCIFLFCIALIYAGRRIFIQKQFPQIGQLMLLLFSILGILNAVLCPGNAARTLSDTKIFFPDYSNFSLIHKLLLGIDSIFAVDGYIFTPYKLILFTFLASIFCLGVAFRKKSTILLSVISLIICNTPIAEMIYQGYPDNHFFHFFPISSYLLQRSFIIIQFLLIVFAVFSIYSKIKNSETSKLIFAFLVSGLGATLIIGFSPLVFASATRVHIILNLCLVIAAYWFAKCAVKKIGAIDEL